MRGLWGFVLSDPSQTARASDLDAMRPKSSDPGSVQTLAVGPAAFAVESSPHRTAVLARLVEGGATLAVALYGSIFNLDEWVSPSGAKDHFGEALLTRYLREGKDAFARLRGDFVVAIWDGRDRSFHLACDRLRVQPVFTYTDAHRLVFASRIRTLISYPHPLTLDVDPGGIVDVLTSSIIPTPHTIYRQVQKLPPATVLTYRDGAVSLRPHWSLRFQPGTAIGERELASVLRERLSDALAARLRVDTNGGYGAFLSGGIDSSTVTGLLTRLADRPVKTFTIGFGEPRFNEVDYARVAARAFRSEHHEYFVQPSDVAAAIPVLLDAYDEPFANASAVPTYYCAKIAKEAGVDVLYAGDGGDELFAGNERYALQRLLDYYWQVPSWIREPVLVPALTAMAATSIPTFVRGLKYVQRARVPYPDRLYAHGLFRELPREEILGRDLLDLVDVDRSFDATLARHFRAAGASNDLDRQLYVDLMLAICDNDLFKVTRATEAAGVTVRYPFLDPPLVEFAATVPASLKMRGTRLRTFFKRAYADLLPPETIAKTKHGFGLPIPVWLRTEPHLNAMMRDLVLSPGSSIAAYFRRPGLEALVERHRTDTTSYYGTFLWNLMVLELWLRQNARQS